MKTLPALAATIGLGLAALAPTAQAADWSIGIGIGLPGVVVVPAAPAYPPPQYVPAYPPGYAPPPPYYVAYPPGYYRPAYPPGYSGPPPYYGRHGWHHHHHDDDDE